MWCSCRWCRWWKGYRTDVGDVDWCMWCRWSRCRWCIWQQFFGKDTVRRSFRENTVFNFLSHAVCFDSLGTVCVDGRECQMAGYMWLQWDVVSCMNPVLAACKAKVGRSSNAVALCLVLVARLALALVGSLALLARNAQQAWRFSWVTLLACWHGVASLSSQVPKWKCIPWAAAIAQPSKHAVQAYVCWGHPKIQACWEVWTRCKIPVCIYFR